MCDVIAMGTLIVGAVSAVVSADAQQKQHDENEVNANKAAQSSMRLLDLRQQQEQKAGAQTIFQMDLQARKADAQTRVAAGEAGVSGASIDALVADIERQRLMAETGTNENTKGNIAQEQQEKSTVRANRTMQVNSVPGANPWATGLKIAGSAAEAGSSYESRARQGSR